MNNSHFTTRSSHVKKDIVSKKADERLRALELERKLLNSGLKEVKIDRFTPSEETNAGLQNSLIKKILDKKFSFKLSNEEMQLDKENDQWEDKEAKTYIDNIRDLTKANEYLEDQLYEQDNVVFQLNRDKIILNNKLQKQFQLEKNINEENRLLREKNKGLQGGCNSTRNESDTLTANINRLTNEVVQLTNQQSTLETEIRELEITLRNKKFALREVVDSLIVKECELTKLGEKKMTFMDGQSKKEEFIKVNKGRLESLEQYRQTVKNNIKILETELELNKRKEEKVEKDKEQFEKLLSEFGELKTRYVNKLDMLNAKKGGLSQYLEDRSLFFSIGKDMADDVLTEKTTFY